MKNKHFKHRLPTPMAMIACLLLALAVIAPSANAWPTPPGNEVTLHISKHWNDVVTYTLTYDVNGGDTSSAPPPQTAYADMKIKINSGIPTRAGYQFLGWAISGIAAAPEYPPDGEILMDADKTLYAVWLLDGVPGSVTTGYTINITTNFATIISNMYEGNFGGQIIQVGVQYSLNPSMTDSMYAVAVMGSPFSANLSSLFPDTTYYYRAFVLTSAGHFCGVTNSFKTYPST